ncbi:UDP-N-acetylmuramoyl-tripeptide--D-alanyl-D-alanine ligase [Halopseudomonas salegens]|uniref:UDP-N-acetylmuramoyl-tripeptide--D-alanyl-D-alanine ligase n=1 Tax=Halopseudomonas salegens TaxID=1434072 RepID=A0A1H2GRE2_9GAMM|nr:UDP-N-acetylmuramoyl-tripeptide--D-alanyl-D-alanine ligase [Halopseudomonas salegens]SDU22283.1 UDP-N-acetylmuramoyl-tripeptide--D-alanyl-D-alanine ligase [Halopseudomonas salegens]
MLEAMTLSSLVQPLSGRLLNTDAQFDRVVIDSRQAGPGCLFVALPGERVDGHDFLAQAREQGAAAALVEHAVDDTLPQLLVADSAYALGQLAALARQDYLKPMVAITGSSGKTTVKEMLAAVLRQRGRVLATRGNLNNELGVPLTLLELGAEHDFAVIEMGAAKAGDLTYSMSLARPQISVLINAGMAHVGRFGGPEQLAKAKGEILTALPADGKAVLNLDSPWFETWYQTLGERQTMVFAVENPSAELRAEAIGCNADGCVYFTLCHLGQRQPVQLALLGEHNVSNALAAAAAALLLGFSLGEIASGLAQVTPVAGRTFPQRGLQGALVIDDSYNANPASVKAAIDLLASLPGQRILALGDMGELGEWEVSSHREVGDYARNRGLQALFTCGPLAALSAEAFGPGAQAFTDKEALLDALRPELGPDTRVLIKGSRTAAMEQVVAGLLIPQDNHQGAG